MLGAIIGAGASLLGGILGNKSSSDANAANLAAQKEFAQKGIQWKVKDATAAGIHPLYALGAQTHAFSPSYVGSSSLGEGVAQAGQEIGRAVAAKGAEGDRQAMAAMAKLQLQRAGLENTLLATQIAKLNAPGTPPPLPPAATGGPSGAAQYLVDGQGSTTLIDPVAMERIMSAPGQNYQEPGAVSDRGFTNTSTGGLAPVYSSDAKTRLEDDWGGMLGWNIRNRLLPTVVGRPVPGYIEPPYKAPPGERWKYSPVSQEWYLVPTNRSTQKGDRLR